MKILDALENLVDKSFDFFIEQISELSWSGLVARLLVVPAVIVLVVGTVVVLGTWLVALILVSLVMYPLALGEWLFSGTSRLVGIVNRRWEDYPITL